MKKSQNIRNCPNIFSVVNKPWIVQVRASHFQVANFWSMLVNTTKMILYDFFSNIKSFGYSIMEAIPHFANSTLNSHVMMLMAEWFGVILAEMLSILKLSKNVQRQSGSISLRPENVNEICYKGKLFVKVKLYLVISTTWISASKFFFQYWNILTERLLLDNIDFSRQEQLEYSLHHQLHNSWLFTICQQSRHSKQKTLHKQSQKIRKIIGIEIDFIKTPCWQRQTLCWIVDFGQF